MSLLIHIGQETKSVSLQRCGLDQLVRWHYPSNSWKSFFWLLLNQKAVCLCIQSAMARFNRQCPLTCGKEKISSISLSSNKKIPCTLPLALEQHHCYCSISKNVVLSAFKVCPAFLNLLAGYDGISQVGCHLHGLWDREFEDFRQNLLSSFIMAEPLSYLGLMCISRSSLSYRRLILSFLGSPLTDTLGKYHPADDDSFSFPPFQWHFCRVQSNTLQPPNVRGHGTVCSSNGNSGGWACMICSVW